MSYQNIILKSVGIYHPKREVPNSFFIDHFKESGMDITELLKIMRRKNRFFADKDTENVITMAAAASKKALAKAELEPKDIDIIIFATDTPEYLCPSNALLLNDTLKTENANVAFDINCNCTGMLTGIDVATRILMTNPHVKRALVVGSMFASISLNTDDFIVYPNFGDSGAAVILEKVDEEQKRGFIDSNFKTDPLVKNNYVNPPLGMSKIYDDIPINDKKLSWNHVRPHFCVNGWTVLINDLLKRNNMDVTQIKQFFFSQISVPNIENTLKRLNLTFDKQTYVGDKYGYTGVTSTIMALNYAFRQKTISKGDTIVLCAVGAGYNMVSILLTL